MTAALPVVVLLGKPGSGKTFLAEQLQSRGASYISSGAVLREAKEKSSNLFVAVEKTPAEEMDLVMQQLDEFIQKQKRQQPSMIVLDVNQPNPYGYWYVSDLLSKHGLGINFVIRLNVSDDLAAERMRSRKRDENDTKKRIDIYSRSGSHLLLNEALTNLPSQYIDIEGDATVTEIADIAESFIKKKCHPSLPPPIRISVPSEANLTPISNYSVYARVMKMHKKVAAGRTFAGTQVSGCLQATPTGELLNKNASKRESQTPTADTHKVSRKVDGTRYLLFIEDDYFVLLRHCHVAYKMQLAASTKKYKSKDSFIVFDGELVQTKSGDSWFIIFDLLAEAGGIRVARKLEERIKLCQAYYAAESPSIFSASTGGRGVSICVKKYFDLSSILELIKEPAGSQPYLTDGLIFTPLRYYCIGSDGNLIKWKPPNLLTADFKLVGTSLYCLRSNPYALVYMDVITGMTNEQISMYQNRIIECKVSSAGDWSFVRIRNDKDHPNLEDVAAASLEACYQVTAEMMCKFFAKGTLTEAIPQARPTPRSDLDGRITNAGTLYNLNGEKELHADPSSREATGNVAVFKRYNNWIKSASILLAVSQCPNKNHLTAFDLGCGKGGDLAKFAMLKKWGTGNIGLYVGIDTSPSSVACCRARYNTARYKFRSVLATASMCDERLLETLFSDTSAPYLNNIMFDVVSSQFAIHYAFSSSRDASTAFSNAAGRLRKGGMFVVTTPDYREIRKVLETRFQNEADIPSEVVITFGDACLTLPLDTVRGVLKDDQQFGMKYHFSLRDLVQGDEYLVPPKLLNSLCSSNGFELVDECSPNFSSFSKVISETNVAAQSLELATTSYHIQQGECPPQILPLYRVLMFRKIEAINEVKDWVCPVAIHKKIPTDC
eukprot:TRINITY_DN7130_c0_g1_i1.p1 TRINITY_DN7130_c0_g1~~TRINITY_DN7130_c0_g1_i1.p1  ORF type:complete len:906 (+),score=132.48 TRINITY_DN7130_c0_g1_i1:48-2720(+)